MKRKRKWRVRLLELFMILLALLQLFPIFYAFVASFKTKKEIAIPLSLPSGVYLGNYENVLKNLQIGTMLLNSLFVTVIAMSCVILIGALAAYPLGRRTDKGFMAIYLFFLRDSLFRLYIILHISFQILLVFELNF